MVSVLFPAYATPPRITLTYLGQKFSTEVWSCLFISLLLDAEKSVSTLVIRFSPFSKKSFSRMAFLLPCFTLFLVSTKPKKEKNRFQIENEIEKIQCATPVNLFAATLLHKGKYDYTQLTSCLIVKDSAALLILN